MSLNFNHTPAEAALLNKIVDRAHRETKIGTLCRTA